MSRQDFDADVIVAGAGPSGLMVACEAALGGARVTVLEKRDGPTWSRAGTLAPRVLEILASRGIVDQFIDRAFELHAEPRSRRGIWAGLPGLEYSRLDSNYPYILMFPQIETERILARHLATLGGVIQLRSEVVGFEQDCDGVEVQYRDPEGVMRSVRGRYLIGADGNKSAVRHSAGINFVGSPATRRAINVDAFVSNPYDQPLTVASSEAGWAMTYPLRDGVTRFALIDAATCSKAADKPPQLDEAKQMLRRVHGSDFGITRVDAITHFHDALCVAEKLRDRHVFLVGESVRVHYPASGVGMNFCLQDAFNLGWKLAAAVGGRAPDWLLDSYVTERRPEIEALLNDVRRQCAIQFNFDAEHVALKHFIEKELLPIPEVNLKICRNLSGLSARYAAPPGSHPIVGQRFANRSLRTASGLASSVFQLLQRQQFVLLDLTGSVGLPTPLNTDQLIVAAAAVPDRPDVDGLGALLLRPDGHVAWAGEQPLREYLPEAELREWLNLPSGRALFAGADSEAFLSAPRRATESPATLRNDQGLS